MNNVKHPPHFEVDWWEIKKKRKKIEREKDKYDIRWYLNIWCDKNRNRKKNKIEKEKKDKYDILPIIN